MEEIEEETVAIEAEAEVKEVTSEVEEVIEEVENKETIEENTTMTSTFSQANAPKII